MKTPVFVYGTLMSFAANSDFLKDAELLGTALTKSNFRLCLEKGRNNVCLFRDEPFGAPVKGELYLVSPEILIALDELERIAAGHYTREVTEVRLVETSVLSGTGSLDNGWPEVSIYIKPDEFFRNGDFSALDLEHYSPELIAKYPYTSSRV